MGILKYAVIFCFIKYTSSSLPWKRVYLEATILDEAVDHNEVLLNYAGNDFQRLINVQTHSEVQAMGDNIMLCFLDSTSIKVTNIMMSPLYQNQFEGLECFTNMQRDWSVGATISAWVFTYTTSPRNGSYLTQGLNIWNVETSFQMFRTYPGIIYELNSIKPITKVYVTKSKKTGSEYILQDTEVKIGTSPYQIGGPNLSYKRFGYLKGEDNVGSGGILKFEREAPMYGNYVIVRKKIPENIVPTDAYFNIAYIQIM